MARTRRQVWALRFGPKGSLRPVIVWRMTTWLVWHPRKHVLPAGSRPSWSWKPWPPQQAVLDERALRMEPLERPNAPSVGPAETEMRTFGFGRIDAWREAGTRWTRVPSAAPAPNAVPMRWKMRFGSRVRCACGGKKERMCYRSMSWDDKSAHRVTASQSDFLFLSAPQ